MRQKGGVCSDGSDGRNVKQPFGENFAPSQHNQQVRLIPSKDFIRLLPFDRVHRQIGHAILFTVCPIASGARASLFERLIIQRNKGIYLLSGLKNLTKRVKSFLVKADPDNFHSFPSLFQVSIC